MLHETSKLDSLPFINFQENNQLKLPKYLSTHIMLLHSIKQYSLTQLQLFLLKAWFPYDRCDRCNHWEKNVQWSQRSLWKPLSSNRSNNDRWKNSISAIVVAAITTIIFCLVKLRNSRLVSIWSLWSLWLLNFFSQQSLRSCGNQP